MAPLDDAEPIADPLDTLAERAKDDPGAPFMPEALAALAELRKADRARFEVVRAALKRAGVRVTALDEALAEESGGDARTTQAEILVGLAIERAAFFHARDGAGFADFEIGGHRETWPIRSRGFRQWLGRLYYAEIGGAPNGEAMQSALNLLEARAAFDGDERQVFLRVGEHDGRLYLDLCDPAWRAVEVDAPGWRVVEAPPVRFRRTAGMRPLPEPEHGGSIADLRPFLNIASEADFVLAVGWMLAALRGRGPFPVLALSGEQGSAKSTFSAIIRALIDPNSAPLRSLPREDRDLFIAATNGWMLAFDNISGLPAWISDTLCRLATGGGFATRQLYSDQDEVLFDAQRPVAINGIEDVVARPDLADRALLLTLEAIPDDLRKPERELWAAFEAVRPRILGALLDGVACGLRRQREVKLAKLPRMADFALWATACEAAFWPAGAFMDAYDGNRALSVEAVIEADPVAAGVRALVAERTVWTGTAADLLGALKSQAGEAAARGKDFPQTPRALSGRLRRAATFLRKAGVEIDFRREGNARVRTVTIAFSGADKAGDFASAPSAPSARTENTRKSAIFGGADADGADGRGADADGRGADADGRGADADGRGAAYRPHASPWSYDGIHLSRPDADGADGRTPPIVGAEKEDAAGWEEAL